jgi:RNA polymerase sporulation-specific sigma factor
MEHLTRLRAGDKDSREEAIRANLALVGYVTSRFLGRGYDYDDLYQYGCIGLMKAVDRFDARYGVAFSTYAVPLIIGEIKRFLREDGPVHVSRTIKENAAKVARAMGGAAAQGGVTMDEICAETGLDMQDAVLALHSLAPVKSLAEPVGGDGELFLQDVLGTDDTERITDELALRQALDRLDETERTLILKRYFERHTQTAIAQDMGLSQVQISRMEKKVLKKLREMFTENTDVGL